MCCMNVLKGKRFALECVVGVWQGNVLSPIVNAIVRSAVRKGSFACRKSVKLNNSTNTIFEYKQKFPVSICLR